MTSFYSGLTGLSAYSNALNIVGNNLANINTTAFKSSVINFEDLVTSTFGGIASSGNGNPMQIGLGALPNSISGVFSQGSIQNTSEATNIAIEGNGFFVVGDSVDDRYYTRAGNFSFNKEGYLVNPAGKYVLGFTDEDDNGNIISSGPLSMIYMPSNSISDPEETTNVQTYVNLDVNAPIDNAATPATDEAEHYFTSVTVYDSKGAPHTLTVEFVHQGLNGAGNDEWTYDATFPGADVIGGVAGTPFSVGNGTVEFDATGTLVVPAADVGFVNQPAAGFTNGSDPMNFTWDLFDDNGVPALTGYPLPSSTSSTNSNGYPPGNLTSMIVDTDGMIQGVFSNGQVEDIGQIATAVFNNPQGLLRLGRNLYAETNSSGTTAIGAPGTGGRGSVMGGALEASNVDIAQQFTDMIIFERGYQANSRIITTSDEVIQQALALKR